MVTVIQRKVGSNGKGPGVDKYIRLPDPDKPRPVVQKGTK